MKKTSLRRVQNPATHLLTDREQLRKITPKGDLNNIVVGAVSFEVDLIRSEPIAMSKIIERAKQDTLSIFA